MKLAGIFCILCTAFVALAGEARTGAVVPFELINVNASAGDDLNRGLHAALSQIANLRMIHPRAVGQGIADSSVSAGGECHSRACLLSLGRYLQSDLIISGAVSGGNGRTGVSVTVIDVQGNATLLTKDYSCASPEDLVSVLPVQIASDIRQTLQLSAAPLPPPQAEIRASRERASAGKAKKGEDKDEDEDEEDEEDEEDSVDEADNGIVKGLTFAASGRWALGKLDAPESRWGAEGLVLYPTSPTSQVRGRLSIPTSRSARMSLGEDIEMPDIAAAVEHEWGWRYFAVTAGIQYMHMQGFSRSNPYYERIETFSDFNTFNWVFGIRGGRPYRGFRGYISYPMPFTMRDNIDDNYFIDYSAIGMFGGQRFKGGLGIQGFYKYRTADSAQSSYYYSYDSRSERYLMAPCGKIAFLVSDRHVVSASLDLSGLVLPFPDVDSDWAPNVALTYTFSMSPLKNAEALDGRF